ncbi:MAG: Hpt domain-containing protein [Flammeovirgaceae bacterium]
MEDKKEIMIDLSYLKTFSDGDLAFVKEMVELFIEKIPMETAELQRAIAAKEWAAAYKAAHDLKSSANFIGLKHVIDGILKIEDCTKNERNFEELDQTQKFVVEQCLAAVEELKEIKIE